MNHFFNFFFGPLNKDSCIYFLLLSIMLFFVLIFVSVFEILFIIKNFKNLNIKMFINIIFIIFYIFLGYFVNRLLYTMCSKSII